jgi:hypothetical protein
MRAARTVNSAFASPAVRSQIWYFRSYVRQWCCDLTAAGQGDHAIQAALLLDFLRPSRRCVPDMSAYV